MGPVVMINTGEVVNGHVSALGHEPHHYTIFYVRVDNVQAHLDKATALGAMTLVPPVDISYRTLLGCKIQKETRWVCSNQLCSCLGR